MKLKLKATQEQMELIKAIGNKDVTESRKAQDMLAAFIAGVVSKVLLQASTLSPIYTDLPYNEDDDPSIPLDLFYDQTRTQWVTVWMQNLAGGLPTSQVEGVAEMKIATYRLDSAVSFAKKYARRSRLDVIAKAVERMAQEILIKQNLNGWAVILRALAEASTNSLGHTVRTTTRQVLLLSDISKLITRMRRLNTSWNGGTPTVLDSVGVTDLFVSPEIKEQIRAFAYNPMNTRAGPAGTEGTPHGSSVGIPLPDAMREEIYRNAGAVEIYGINLSDLNELGVSQTYNQLFGTFATGNIATGTSGSAEAFVYTTHEVLVGFDLSREAFVRPVAQNAESGATVTTMTDDQWVVRSDKAGYYTSIDEGRCCLASAGVCGIIA